VAVALLAVPWWARRGSARAALAWVGLLGSFAYTFTGAALAYATDRSRTRSRFRSRNRCRNRGRSGSRRRAPSIQGTRYRTP